MTKIVGLIAGGGKGRRINSPIPKQFLPLKDKPILTWTLETFQTTSEITEIILVVPKEKIEYCWEEIVEKYRFLKVKKILPGGMTRQASVWAGLQACPQDTEIVVIHDAVRPFVKKEIIVGSIKTARRSGAAVAAIPVVDTIKRIKKGRKINETLDRTSLVIAQTPQTFKYSLIFEAYRKAFEENYSASDDASLLERLGYPIKLIPGSPSNIKITTPQDLAFGNFILTHFPRSRNLISGSAAGRS